MSKRIEINIVMEKLMIITILTKIKNLKNILLFLLSLPAEFGNQSRTIVLRCTLTTNTTIIPTTARICKHNFTYDFFSDKCNILQFLPVKLL